MPYTTCLRCKRPLKDPVSMDRGYGPVCAGKVGAQREATRNLFEAEYEVVRVQRPSTPPYGPAMPGMVWIHDLDRGARSVTNDADRVVAKLHAEYPDYRIVYRDSMGRWDELRHEHGRFTAFAPAGEFDPEVAHA